MVLMQLFFGAEKIVSQGKVLAVETTENAGFWDRIINWFNLNYIDFIMAGSVILAAIILNFIFRKWLKNKILKITKKTDTEYDDVILKSLLKPVGFIIIVIGVYFAIKIATCSIHENDPEHSINQFLSTALKTIFSLVIGWILWCMTDLLDVFLIHFTSKTKSTLDDQLVPMVRKGAKILIICMIGVMILDNAGVSITGIITGLGVGALAFALAGQEIVANLFGSIIIFVDRPFNIGDVITVDGKTGVVSEVGFRSTRIQTFEKTEIIIPNKDISHKSIENISKRPKRRARFNYCFTVDSKPEHLQAFITEMEEFLDVNENIEENPYVKLTGLNELGLTMLIQYWIADLNFDLALQINNDTTMKVLELSQKYNCPLASRQVAVNADANKHVSLPPKNKDNKRIIASAKPTETMIIKGANADAKKNQPKSEFKPTKAQEKYLTAVKKPKNMNLTKEKAAEKAGISAKTYQKWSKDENFIAWLESNI